jgi:hypothetical protein
MMNFNNNTAIGETGNRTVDVSEYSNNGTCSGMGTACNFTDGKFGKALSFDGSDDFVIGNASNFPLNDSARTIMAWIKISDTDGDDKCIVHYGVDNGDSPPTNFHLFASHTHKATMGNGYGYGTVEGTTNVDDNKWHFVAGVYEGPGTDMVRIYVDGIEENSDTIDTPGTLSGSYKIGEWLSGSAGQINGLIDEIRVYNRSLPTGEIRQQYFSNLKKYDADKWQFYTNQSGLSAGTYNYFGCAANEWGENCTSSRNITILGEPVVPSISFVPPTPPNGTSTVNRSFVFNASISGKALDSFNWGWGGANYTFYDNDLLLMLGLNNLSALGEDGTTVADSSLYGNNGTVYNAVWNESGKYGGGYVFNGDNTVINVTGLKQIAGVNNEFTIEAWINPVQGGSGAIVTKSVANQDQAGDFILYLEPTDRIAFAMHYGGWHPSFIWNPSTTTYVDYGNWSHVVVTHTNQSDGLRVYLNGQLLGNNSGITQTEATNHPILVGMQGGGGGGWVNRFNGTIDEVRIYNRSISEAEVLEHYRSNLYKYANDKLLFQSNRTNLSTGTYTYQACARNASGENCTGLNTLDIFSTAPKIFFVPPTPQNASNTTTTVLINISANTTSLEDFKWNWNGTNYSMYDGSIAIFNFDNDSELGENNTNVRDISRYNNNGIINNAVYVTGKNGKALQFFGNSSSHVNVSSLTKAMGQNSSVTAMIWVKVSSATIPDSYIMTKGYAYVDREGDFLF